jgi:hypothetical protein
VQFQTKAALAATMNWLIIAGIASGALPLWLGWLLVTGLRRGVIRASGPSYSRATQPKQFWIVAATYAGMTLLWGVTVFQVVTAMLRTG